MAGNVERVLVIGLDCAAPQFVFGPGRFDLPNLTALADRGCWGRLESCHPPITVPAWASMLTGKDPGTLGFYGFRNRLDHSYDPLVTANATAVREPRVWDILSRCGKKSVVVGVPQTYPPTPLNGWLAAGFLTPDRNAPFTYPKRLKSELESAVGEYILDVADFRTDDKHGLLERIYAFMENRFATAEHLLETKPWDFFMLVEMGMDRLHHGFWKFCDPAHPKFESGTPFEHVFREYYQAVDHRIGDLVGRVGDETAVLVVSDHGAKPMLGGLRVNQWLINEGYLVVHDLPQSVTRIEDCAIDWRRTKAWSTGGYYARVFLNVEGREPQGTISPGDYESFRDDLAAQLEAIPGPDGRSLGTKAHRPEDLYRTVNGVAPDLLVYFGDLSWRAVGTVGSKDLYTTENDLGPDDANHDHYGILILDDRTERGGHEMTGLQLMDVAPTVLGLLGVEVPEDMQGTSIG